MIYIAILFCTTVANQSSQFTTTEMARIQSMMQPTGTDITSFGTTSTIGAGYSMITNVWSYIVVFAETIFLWSPTLWSGNWYWFYLFVCVPLCIAMTIGIVQTLRGVNSG
jgi:hypothetical protein